MIRLRVLGPVELEGSDGRELRAVLAQPKRLALLAYLVAGPRGFHRRDTLLALFWPELDHAHARTSLNQAIRFLRRELGDSSAEIIVSRGAEEVGVDAHRLWCDAVAFADHTYAGRYAEALELYRSDLLAGFFADGGAAFEEWIERERARLRSTAAKAARGLAEAREREGNFTTAVASARRAVELSDADERIVRDLLELLDRLGDRAGAVHAYEAFARRLADDFGASPASETIALMDRIRVPSLSGWRAGVAAEDPVHGLVTNASGVRPAPAPQTVLRPTAGPGMQLNRWRVERELGQGGMSIVYLAHDAKHDRRVALKVLRPELTISVGVERFLREIQITASLAHPHILPLIDSGTSDGLLYLVMPYVAGESLRARLQREPRLPLADAVQIATEVAEALDYAHRSGIIHRDVKPENILLADGHAVLADFGVARALSVSGGATPIPDSDPEAVVGSRAYMSPEQASAGADVSTRTDLYSLGGVMFEMLTGDLARGDESAADVRARRSDIPRELARVVSACVSKTPERRPDSAAALLRGLASVESRGTGSARGGVILERRVRLTARHAGLAVGVSGLLATGFLFARDRDIRISSSLPTTPAWRPNEALLVTDFHVAGVDTSIRYALGFAMRTALTQSSTLSVVPPDVIAAALQRMRRPPSPLLDLTLAREVAAREGIRAIVHGHVTRTGRTFDVGLRLVAANSGTDLVLLQASASTEDDIIPTLDRLTRKLRETTGESVKRIRESPPLPQVTTHSLEALRWYAEGNAEPDFERGLSLLKQAVAADSEFAEAWRKLAVLYGNLGIANAAREAAANNAFRHRTKLPVKERLRIEGWYSSRTGSVHYDRARSVDAYEQLLAMGDSNFALINLAELLWRRREFARAESLDQAAVRKIPDCPFCFVNLMQRQIEQNKLAEAEATLDLGLTRRPNNWVIEWSGIRLLYHLGRLDAFERAADSLRAIAHPGKRRAATSALRDIALLRGRLTEWERLRVDAQTLDAAAGAERSALDDALAIAEVDVAVRGDTGRAVRRVQDIVEADSLRRPDHLRVASFFGRAGRADLARKAMARYETLADTAWRRIDAPAIHRALAHIALAEGRAVEALEEFRRSDMRPDGPADPCHVCFYLDMGTAFDQAGQSDSAVTMYERYVNTPFSARWFRIDPPNLAQTLLRLGELHEARAHRERAIHYYGRFVELWKFADAELQPQVNLARRRLAQLRSTPPRQRSGA